MINYQKVVKVEFYKFAADVLCACCIDECSGKNICIILLFTLVWSYRLRDTYKSWYMIRNKKYLGAYLYVLVVVICVSVWMWKSSWCEPSHT